MSVPLIVTAQQVRDILTLNVDATSKYSDQTINSNIRTSLEFLEHAANRYFYDRPNITLTLTTNGQAQIALPGFHSIDSVTWNQTDLTLDQTYWLWPDELNSGMILAVSVRPFVNRPEGPIWLASPQWFDRGLDLHRYPAGYGYGPYDQGSLPGDLVVVGDGGFDSTAYPDSLLLAVKYLAATITLQPQTLLSGGILGTADGNGIDISEWPAVTQRFVRLYRATQTQAVSL